MNQLQQSLSALPEDLGSALYQAYLEVQENYAIGRWEPTELNGGKLCEVVFRILEWFASGQNTFTPLGTSIRNIGHQARQFVNDPSLPDGIRFHLPQAIDFLYTLRNKRGVGHVAGDIDPNHMDASAVIAMTKWIVAEIVRLLNDVTADVAKATVEEITAKMPELVWCVGEKRRVLAKELGYKEQTLLLLHREHPRPVDCRLLFEWTEYSRLSSFRTNILKRCHSERLIEYDESSGLVYLSPNGIQVAEEIILKHQGYL